LSGHILHLFLSVLWQPLIEQTKTTHFTLHWPKKLNTTKLLFACQATNNCINYACSEIFLGVKMRTENVGKLLPKGGKGGKSGKGIGTLHCGDNSNSSLMAMPAKLMNTQAQETICACKIWEFISLFCHRRVFAYPISL